MGFLERNGGIEYYGYNPVPMQRVSEHSLQEVYHIARRKERALGIARLPRQRMLGVAPSSFSTPFQKHALIRPGLVCERRTPLNGSHGRVPILQLGVPHVHAHLILSETSPTTSTNPNAPASNTTAAATSVRPPSSPISPTTTPLPTKVVSPFPLYS